MIEKAIIFLFIFAFLSSTIAPDYANAMGQSTWDNETVIIVCAATIGITLIALYFTEWRDVEKTEICESQTWISLTVRQYLAYT